MKLANLPIEEIVWEDHFSTDDWKSHDDGEIAGTMFVSSIGYRLKENRQRIVLVQNVSDSDQVSGTITVLKKTIKKRTVIREAQ